MKYCLLFIFAFVLFGITNAQDYKPEKFGMTNSDLPLGLNIGDTAPNILIKGVNGSDYSLYEALKRGPVVINFYRGNWCPYCTRYLSSLNDSVSQIVQLGASFIAISPENPEEIKKSSKGLSKDILILNDSDAKVMKAYDVDFYVTENYEKRVEKKIKRDAEGFYNQEDLIFPLPATYIVNSEGIIIYRFFDVNYSKRAAVKNILEALKTKNVKS